MSSDIVHNIYFYHLMNKHTNFGVWCKVKCAIDVKKC